MTPTSSTPPPKKTECPEYLSYLGFQREDCEHYPDVACTAKTQKACEEAVRALIDTHKKLYALEKEKKS